MVSDRGAHSEHIVISPYSPHHVPQVSTYNTFTDTFRYKPHKLALVDTDSGKSYTFRQAEANIEAIAGRLHKDGFRKLDRLAVCCRNCLDYPLFVAATLRLGGTIVGINHILTTEDIKQQIRLGGARFVLTGGDSVSKVMEAVAASDIKVYVTDTQAVSEPVTTTTDIYNDLSQHSLQLPPVRDLDIDPSEPGFILFSSGTTGFPKPVVISHSAMINTSYNLRHPEVSMVTESQLVYQPMCHVFGMNLILLTFMFGTTTFIMPKFDLERYIQLVCKHKVTMIHVVPPVAVMLSKSPLLDKYDITCVRNIATGAGPIGGATEKLLITRLKSANVRFRQVYGMTETSGIITMTPIAGHPLADVPRGSVGLLAPNTKAKVVDVNTGQSLAAHCEGEIWVQGPQLMLEYEHRHEETLNTIDRHGWLHTGDIGKYDERGFFFITDRLKELIKYKGYQVAPVELEQHLLTHPAVQDAGVYSIPDAVAGELPRAWVVLKPDASSITEEQILAFINGHVAPFKRIRGGIRFVKEIPRSASGKILRRMMKKAENTTSKL